MLTSKKGIGLAAVKFLPPIILWVFLFRFFLTGRTVIITENFMFYSMVRAFLDNLRLGVVPLWEPYLSWGTINTINLAHIGPFNPLWLFVLMMDLAGLSPYHAYLTGIALYFFAGGLGFYLLAKTFLKNAIAAYAAFLLLLFSSLSMPLPGQLMPLFLFVPMVWFFFFLIGFCDRFEKKYFLGMVFSGILIATTYLPFYFLTLLSIVLLTAGILFFHRIPFVARGYRGFLRRHFFLTVFSGGLIVLALLPSVHAFLSASSQEIVSPERHADRGRAFAKGVELENYFTGGAFSSRMSFEDLYAHLDQIQYATDGFFYVSIFAFLVLFLGAFNKIDRKILLLTAVLLFVFLLSLGNVTPLYPFLFKHVFFVRLFRNMHYFLPSLLAMFCLLVGYHLKLFLEGDNLKTIPLAPALSAVVWIHAGLAVFLLSQENIIVSSYVTIGFSFLFFLYLLLRRDQAHQPMLYGLLFLCVATQPVEVFWHYHQHAPRGGSHGIIDKSITFSGAKPTFSYTRPAITGYPQEDYVDYFNASRIWMRDTPGFMMPEKAFPSFWSYYVSQSFPDEVFRAYTGHKFYLYDRIALAFDQPGDDEKIKAVFQNRVNRAIVHLDDQAKGEELASLTRRLSPEAKAHALAVNSDSNHFEVLSFNANEIKIRTEFDQEEFLVYTDSFHSDWKAWLNGVPTRIYRTNLAFKGLRLPAGLNVLEIRFQPAGGTGVYFLMILFSLGLFVAVVVSFIRAKETV